MTSTLLGVCLLVLQGAVRQTDLSKLGGVDTPSLARLILSTNVQERKDAYPYAMVNMIGLYRARSKPFLLNVIHSNPLISANSGSPNNEEDRYSPRRIALSILAEWHDPELIPVFIENVDYVAEDPNRSGLSKAPDNEYYAAVKGLINIGRPSIQPCLKELAKNNAEAMRFLPFTPNDYQLALCRRGNIVFVINRIVGNAETRSLLGKEIERLEKSDPDGAANLREAAKLPLIHVP